MVAQREVLSLDQIALWYIFDMDYIQAQNPQITKTGLKVGINKTEDRRYLVSPARTKLNYQYFYTTFNQ